MKSARYLYFMSLDFVSADRSVAVITGATGGIGRFIALGLARAEYRLILICRERERAEVTRAWIADGAPHSDIEVQIADLSLLSATGKVGHDIAANNSRISLLINNAGVFETRQETTAEGFDRVLAVNLLSPFVLTQTLLPSLLAGAPSRIVNVGSSTSDQAQIDPDNLVLGPRWTMLRAYGQSKLALMMTSFALAKRLAGTGVTVNVVHPGLVATGLVRSGGIIGLVWRCLAVKALTEEQGADTPLHVALAPELQNVSGVYFKKRRPAPPNSRALDPALQEQVWAATESLAALPRLAERG
jgi:NAD(P)-dependent dehydrogenase (short-subunit alcohol dehydrogenase family)